MNGNSSKEQILDSSDDDNQKESVKLTTFEIFRYIWFSPKKVLQNIHEHKVNRHLLLLIVLYGVLQPIYDELSLFIVAQSLNTSFYVIHWNDLFIEFLYYPVIVLFMIGLTTFFVWLIGKGLGGKGTIFSLFRVFVYAFLPIIIPIKILFSFSSWSMSNSISWGFDLQFEPIRIAYGFIILGTVLWIIIKHVVATSIVQNFTIKRSILNYLLGLVLTSLLFVFI